MMPENEIIVGSCLEVMKDWPDNCVDLVLTDPPYGIGKAEWDKKPPDEYVKHCLRLGVCSGLMPGVWLLPDCLALIGDEYLGLIAAHNKNGMTFSPLGFGNWIPVVIAGTPLKRGPDAFDFVVRGDMPDHPSPNPIDCMLWLVNRLTNEGDLILDPFCGSGTTCVAAKMLGRRYIGIDISPEYCKIARERLEAVETGVPVKEARAGQMPLFKNK